MGRINQSEDFSNEQKEYRLAKYRRLSRIMFYLAIILAICTLAVIFVLPFSQLLVALILALGVLLTGVAAVIFQVLSGADIDRFPWLQNSQWSIMNRSGHDIDEDSQRHS